MANVCLKPGYRFVATLASKLLRSPSSRLQSTRNASYCVLRAKNPATNRRAITHLTSNVPVFHFSSLGCCLGCGVRGRIKSNTPLWITVPGITGEVLIWGKPLSTNRYHLYAIQYLYLVSEPDPRKIRKEGLAHQLGCCMTVVL